MTRKTTSESKLLQNTVDLRKNFLRAWLRVPVALYTFILCVFQFQVVTMTNPSTGTGNPFKIDSSKGVNFASNKLVAMNVGIGSSSNVLKKQQQLPYPYKDDDFVIPTLKQQPRHIQRYMNQQKSTHHQRHHIPTITASPANAVFISLAVASLSKAVYRIWTIATKNNTIPQQQFSERPMTVYDVDADIDDVDIDGVVDSSNSEEDTIVVSPSEVSSMDSNATTSSTWQEKYDHLIVEATSLREQLSTIQQMLEKQELEKSEAAAMMPTTAAEDVVESAKENAEIVENEIQSLNESIQYWKRVAQMNEEKVNNALKVERQNSIQQLELCKREMLDMVEQERTAMSKDFTAMIQELRDSLNV